MKIYEESPKLELKREITDGLKKEIIAFANTDGGKILIGIEDDGTVVGLKNAHKDFDGKSRPCPEDNSIYSQQLHAKKAEPRNHAGSKLGYQYYYRNT